VSDVVKSKPTIEARFAAMRQAYGVSGNRLAQIAHDDLGLPWFPSTVAAIEAGSKKLTAEELLLLPLLFRQAGIHLSLSDFFEAELVLGDIVASPAALAELFRGRLPGSWQEQASTAATDRDAAVRLVLKAAPSDGRRRKNQRSEKPFADAEVRAALIEAGKAIAQLGPLPEDARREQQAELTQRTARQLGLPATQVAETARRLWQANLTWVRDVVAEILIRRTYQIRNIAESPEAMAALPFARRRASAVLKQEIRAALRRYKPKERK
jgi:hypothetical protein